LGIFLSAGAIVNLVVAYFLKIRTIKTTNLILSSNNSVKMITTDK
jgi:hypothetical protein